jgi:beta-galactosidase
VKGDLAIVFVPEAERFNFAQQGNTSNYSDSARGAYMAFFDSNVQPDWVHIDNIGEYGTAYLPYPVMLTRESAAKLRQFVEGGGTLISEGVPGYFGEGGHAGAVQPNAALAEVFGAAETDVEFTPDLLEKLSIRMGAGTMGGRLFKETFRPTTGKAAGWYGDGAVAAVENRFGKGRTVLIGTFPGAAYFRNQNEEWRRAFRALMPGGQHATVSNPAVIARLHEGAGGTVLWVVNPTRKAQAASVTLDRGPWTSGKDVWSNLPVRVSGSTVAVEIPARDAAVIQLGN